MSEHISKSQWLQYWTIDHDGNREVTKILGFAVRLVMLIKHPDYELYMSIPTMAKLTGYTERQAFRLIHRCDELGMFTVAGSHESKRGGYDTISRLLAVSPDKNVMPPTPESVRADKSVTSADQPEPARGDKSVSAHPGASHDKSVTMTPDKNVKQLSTKKDTKNQELVSPDKNVSAPSSSVEKYFSTDDLGISPQSTESTDVPGSHSSTVDIESPDDLGTSSSAELPSPADVSRTTAERARSVTPVKRLRAVCSYNDPCRTCFKCSEHKRHIGDSKQRLLKQLGQVTDEALKEDLMSWHEFCTWCQQNPELVDPADEDDEDTEPAWQRFA